MNTIANTHTKPLYSTRHIAVAAVFMAMNIALSSFGVPVPGGHLYLCDIAICTASILLDPVSAFVVGGIGSFLGDVFFYPAPMFVSLVTHGLQAAVISLCAHHLWKNKKPLAAGVGVTIGAVIMVVGYTLGKAFVYSTPEYAIIKLPFEIAQAAVGAVVSMILCFKFKLLEYFNRLFNQ
ncbi:MAG TPA: ECF transporter S component [Lachnospiraceae bacterium]|nr:ECF transporter S component [Lachnospiraceae bacterium]